MPLRRGRKPEKIPGPGPCATCGGVRWVTISKVRVLCPACNGSGTTEPDPAPDKLP